MAGRIFITGDIHGEPLLRFGSSSWPIGKDLDKRDYVIVLGDMGLLWRSLRTRGEEKNIKWLDDKPWTTLFIDGNHENFDLLDNLPRKQFFGAEVGILAHSVYHLLRGRIYWINYKKFLTLGGAHSHDREWREWGKSMWHQEEITGADIDKAKDGLLAAQNKVDYVLTHCAPIEYARNAINPGIIFTPDNSEAELSRLKASGFEYRKWFFGHYHEDVSDPIHDKWQCLYENIIELPKE